MVKNTHNLFASLGRWASRQGENFLTESFVVTLRQVIAHEPRVAARILAELTGGILNLEADAVSDVRISTQTTTDSGRPDIEIRTSDTLVYVEVKDEAGLGDSQLDRYREELNRSAYAKTCLVLLTRYRADANVDFIDVVQRRWIQIADMLEQCLSSGAMSDESTRFLVGQFVGLLECKGLAMAKVERISLETVRSLRNLCDILYEAASRCGVALQRTADWTRIGISLDKGRFYVGVSLDDADKVVFLTGQFRVDFNAAAELQIGEVFDSEWAWWTLGPHRWRNTLDLSANDGEFYGLSAAEQLKRLETFLRQSLDSARRIEASNVPESGSDRPQNGTSSG